MGWMVVVVVVVIAVIAARHTTAARRKKLSPGGRSGTRSVQPTTNAARAEFTAETELNVLRSTLPARTHALTHI